MEGSTLGADGVASNPSAAILTAPVSDASAWRAADFVADRGWIVALTEAAVGEVDAALRHAQRQDSPPKQLRATAFRCRALTAFSPMRGMSSNTAGAFCCCAACRSNVTPTRRRDCSTAASAGIGAVAQASSAVR